MSLGLFGLLVVWLIDGNIKTKLSAFWNNKPALIISSIYLISVLGLIHTSNFDFAFADLRRKLPLFFIPFCIAGFSTITKKELHFLLKIFILGVLISTLWSFFVYLGGLNITIIDKRELSRFYSHIRLGLSIALAIFFCFYLLIQYQSIKTKFLWLTVLCWLIATLFIFSLFTGLVVFVITALFLLVVISVNNKSHTIRFSAITITFVGIISGTLYISSSIKEFKNSISTKTLEDIPYTKEGNPYQQNKDFKESALQENGYFIDKHISWVEIEGAWNQRSSINFNTLDLKGQQLKHTLIRFVTSKGQRKDKEAIEQLSQKEVEAIENGISNYKYLEMNSINKRIHQILWEYNAYANKHDVNGHSVLMRWMYWETALKIVKNNLFIGVGTGDIQDAFNEQYKKDNSILTEQYRLRTHNQYLTYAVSLGLFGFCWFLGCFLFPFLKKTGYKNYLYLAFFSIAFLSMLSEDTLEVQAGISFFAFFNTLFVLQINKDKA